MYAGSILDDDPFEISVGLARCGSKFRNVRRRPLQTLLYTFECGCKSFGMHGLQKIVNGMHIKRSHRECVIRRYKDNGDLRSEEFEHLESIQFWHLNVQ